jgi:hypothetical protein
MIFGKVYTEMSRERERNKRECVLRNREVGGVEGGSKKTTEEKEEKEEGLDVVRMILLQLLAEETEIEVTVMMKEEDGRGDERWGR